MGDDLGPSPAAAYSQQGGSIAPKPSPDKVIARLLAVENLPLAQYLADSLAKSGNPQDAEIGLYWKAVCYLYRDIPDSAITVLEPMRGKWAGGLRRIHSEAFLRLARVASDVKVVRQARRDDAPSNYHDRGLLDRIDGLQRENAALKANTSRLETQILKYEKLLKDLETIR